MKAELAYAFYRRSFLVPFVYGAQSVRERTGIFLRQSVPNAPLISEASPLPGHSTDSLAEVEKALRAHSAASLFGMIEAGEAQGLPPSLRFGIEGLHALAVPGPCPVATNALLRWGGPVEPQAQLEGFVRAGYSHCKLKVSPENFMRSLDLIEETPEMRFRLDANLTLSPAILSQLIDLLERRSLLSRVEYLEEPFSGMWDAASFRGSPLAFAADESAAAPGPARALLGACNPPSVFVVKPTVAGGLFSLEPFLDVLRAAGKRIVFTSALEAEPGRRAILAYLSRTPAEVAGLSTGHLYGEDFLGDRPLWRDIPLPNEAEQRFLETLDWRRLP